MERVESKLSAIEVLLAEIKGQLSQAPKGSDFISVRADIAEIKGRLSGIDARFSSLPTTWTLLGIVFTTWALGSGILIFALNVLKR